MGLLSKIGAKVAALLSGIMGTPSLRLEAPAPPPWKGRQYKREDRFTRKLNRYIWQRAKWEAQRIGPPILKGERLRKIAESCSASGQLVLCRGRRLSEDAKLI